VCCVSFFSCLSRDKFPTGRPAAQDLILCLPACLLHLFIHLHVSPHSLSCATPNRSLQIYISLGASSALPRDLAAVCCALSQRHSSMDNKNCVNNENSIHKRKKLGNTVVCSQQQSANIKSYMHDRIEQVLRCC